MKTLFLFISIMLIMFLSITMLMAQTTTPALVGISNQTYTIGVLLALSLLGILLHWLVDLQKAEKQAVPCSIGAYVTHTWVSSAISFLMCVIAIIIRHELNNIPDFTNWEGGAMVAIGYMGDSLLPIIFGFAKTKGFDAKQND